MRHYAYMFLKGVTQLLSIPFIIWVFMIVTFGFTEIGSYPLTWALVIACVIIFTTAALIPYLYTLFMAYRLLRTFEKKDPVEDSTSVLDKVIKSSLYFTGLMFITLPFVYLFVEKDDSPGLLLMYILGSGAGLLSLAIAYVLKDVLNTVIKKGDNDVKSN